MQNKVQPSRSDGPTLEEIEAGWARKPAWVRFPNLPESNQWLSAYYKFIAYYGLVFSYLWRVVGTAIVVINTWTGLRDPEFQRQWLPLWGSALLLAGIWALGHVIALGSSWGIRRLTGRPPWVGRKSG